MWLSDEALLCDGDVAKSPERKNGLNYFNLLRPAVYQYRQCLRPFEDVDLVYSAIAGGVIALYLVDGQKTGDEVVVAWDDDQQRDVIEQFPRRMRALVVRGRERFTVRRFCEVEIAAPSLRDRHRAVTTRHQTRGKFKRGIKNDKAVRLPQLLTISTIDRLPNHLF